MHPLHPLYAITIFIIAFSTARLIRLKYKIKYPESRNERIDGIRGFLAIFVFIHHSSIWHQYVETGKWEFPKSNLFGQMGTTSVSLFFMITSFLFISKLFDSANKDFDWPKFFLSRIFRLLPLYFFSTLLITIVVMFACQWQLNTEVHQFFVSLFQRAFFTKANPPDINNYEYTSQVNAGVEWTLAYELFFYFSLPLVSIFIFKNKPDIKYILLGLIFMTTFYFVHQIRYYYIYPFIGGAITPILLKFNLIQKKIKDIYATIITLICLFLLYRFSFGLTFRTILITIIFNSIALSGTIFGLLKNYTIKFLGEICYSTYLLHGIILFTFFYFVFGLETMRKWTPLQFSFAVFSITPVVVIISVLSYKYIERPSMDRSKKIIQKLTGTRKTRPVYS